MSPQVDQDGRRLGLRVMKTWMGFHFVFFVILTVHGWYYALLTIFYLLLSYCVGDLVWRLSGGRDE